MKCSLEKDQKEPCPLAPSESLFSDGSNQTMEGNYEEDSFSNALLKETKKTLASGSHQMIETGSLFPIGPTRSEDFVDAARR